MVVTSPLAVLGSLLADDTRAGLLAILMDGRAHTGGELAHALAVAPSTASEHLSKLLDAGMVAVEAQGRHRYFRLAGPDIAELLETIGGSFTAREARPAVRAPAALAHARSCYDHLAGELAVRLYDHLVSTRQLTLVDHRPVLTPNGRHTLAGLGIDAATPARRNRPAVRHCLDWTERRHHLAGSVGAALLSTMLERRWMVRGVQPRALRLTSAGHDGLARHFGLDVR